jgi:cyclic pyranopterin phosphate synthase
MLEDNFNRKFSYLRLSITDVCNFRCSYCLPDGYKKNDQNQFLSIDEIKNLVSAFSELGVSKVRLTGGEPTVRKDFSQIISAIKNIQGIEKIVFTTNGYCLKQHAKEFFDSGADSVNISVDSLNAENFKKITGHNKLKEVLEGLEEALNTGFKVKINAVLLKNLNDLELDNFINFVKNKPISIRFIELMQTGDNFDYFNKHHLSSEIIKNNLCDRGWKIAPREHNSGPAIEYFHHDYLGKIGIIAPYSKNFCDGCNRLRITAVGDLRLCLFGNSSHSLRPLLQDKNQKNQLQESVIKLLRLKDPSHLLQEGKSGLVSNLSSLGG